MKRQHRDLSFWESIKWYLSIDADLYKYLPRLMFHPLVILVAVLVLLTSVHVSKRWVLSSENFNKHSFEKISETLRSQTADNFKRSVKIFDGFNANDVEFTEGQWKQFALTLEGLRNEHAISSAWYVKLEGRPAAKPDPNKLYSKEIAGTYVISSQPIIENQQTFPLIAATWNHVDGSFFGKRISTQQPAYVLDAAYRAANVGGRVSLRESSFGTGLVVAIPIFCQTGSKCREALVVELQAQLALNSLINKHLVAPGVSVGMTWGTESTLIAAHPATMHVSSNPDKEGIIQKEKTFQVENEVIELVISRKAWFVGVTDRSKYLSYLYAGSFVLAALVYCFLVLILFRRKVEKDEHVSLAHRLDAKERQLVSLSDAAPFGIMITDSRYNCVYANSAIEKLFQKEVSELQGIHWFKAIDKASRKNFSAYEDTEAQQKIETKTIEVIVVVEEEKFVNCTVRLLPIYQGDVIAGYTMIFNYITKHEELALNLGKVREEHDKALKQIVELQEEIEGLEEDLEESQQEVTLLTDSLSSERISNADNPRVESNFLSNLRDELRTPLAKILEIVADAEESQLIEDEIGIERINEICDHGEKALCVLDDLLDFSKIDSRKVAVEQIACSPLSLLTEIGKVMVPKAESQGISYGVEVVGVLPGHFSTDRFRLRKVLQHLINNAVTFTQNGGVKVCVSHNNETETMHYEIIDTGPGMEQSLIDKLYADNDDLDSEDVKELAAFRNTIVLIEEIEGEIRIESKLGRGTVVEILVPAHVKLPEGPKDNSGKKTMSSKDDSDNDSGSSVEEKENITDDDLDETEVVEIDDVDDLDPPTIENEDSPTAEVLAKSSDTALVFRKAIEWLKGSADALVLTKRT